MTPYEAIAQRYSGRKAVRSGVPLINHIDEGLRVLTIYGASPATLNAFCLHPLLRSDEDLSKNLRQACRNFDPYALALAMEYRATANAALSDQVIDDNGPVWPGPWPKLSPLHEVNLMLIADKVQNRADFEIYHQATHPRSAELALYYQVWLEVLGVHEANYIGLVLKMKQGKF